jgi:DnaJ-class molecular chaperone
MVTCQRCWESGLVVWQTMHICPDCHARKAAKDARRAARRAS